MNLPTTLLAQVDRAIGDVVVVEAELSLAPVYKDAPLAAEVIDHLVSRASAS